MTPATETNQSCPSSTDEHASTPSGVSAPSPRAYVCLSVSLNQRLRRSGIQEVRYSGHHSARLSGGQREGAPNRALGLCQNRTNRKPANKTEHKSRGNRTNRKNRKLNNHLVRFPVARLWQGGGGEPAVGPFATTEPTESRRATPSNKHRGKPHTLNN